MATTPSVLAKTERNQEIIQRVLDGKGEVSLTEIAKEYGLTRARIQRIVGEKGISIRTMRRKNRKPARVECPKCGGTYAKGTYVEHCRIAGHRRLTPSGEKVERNAEVVDLHGQGYNTTEIADYFAIPQPVVTRILHRAGIRAEGRRKRKGGLPNRRPVAV